jgi:hypothetical protein
MTLFVEETEKNTELAKDNNPLAHEVLRKTLDGSDGALDDDDDDDDDDGESGAFPQEVDCVPGEQALVRRSTMKPVVIFSQ